MPIGKSGWVLREDLEDAATTLVSLFHSGDGQGAEAEDEADRPRRQRGRPSRCPRSAELAFAQALSGEFPSCRRDGRQEEEPSRRRAHANHTSLVRRKARAAPSRQWR